MPPAVAAEAAGHQVRVVWLNRLGGMTCEAGAGPDRWFVKWVPAASGADLRGEAARLRWAATTWNVTVNYGPGWEGLLLDAYGVPLDAARTRYYRLLGRCY